MPDHVEPDVPQWSPVPDAFLGIYYLETRDNLHRTAEFIALEESAGSWSGGSAATPRIADRLGLGLVWHRSLPAGGSAASPPSWRILPERAPPSPATWLYRLPA